MPGGRMNWGRVRAENKVTAGRRSPDPLPVLHGRGCWCGKPLNHDWPRKQDGAPHPREEDSTS